MEVEGERVGREEAVGLPLREECNEGVKEAEADEAAVLDTMSADTLALGLRETEEDPEGEGEMVIINEGVEVTDREAQFEGEEWVEGLALGEDVSEGEGVIFGEFVKIREREGEVEGDGEAEDAILLVPPCFEGVWD